METLMGVETEYALTVVGRNGNRRDPAKVTGAAMDLAERQFPNVEAAGDGIFVGNGGRIYPDVGDKLEYCTPECPTPTDLVRYTIAGDRLMGKLAIGLQRSNRGSSAMVFRGNTGYSSPPTSWACHENFLCRHAPGHYAGGILAFLSSRLILAGAGGFNPFSPGLEWSLSPRAAFLKNVTSNDTQSSRAILNLRDEPLASNGYHRLHLILGDALGSQAAMWLRAGSTALVVALIDSGLNPAETVTLVDPLDAIRKFAADPTLTVAVPTRQGEMTAIEIQQRYVDAVRKALPSGCLPHWAEPVVHSWQATLDLLRSDRERLSTVLDWMIKREVYGDHCRLRGFTWEALPHFTSAIGRLRRVYEAAKLDFPGVFAPNMAPESGPVRNEIQRQTDALGGHGLDLNDLGRFQTLRAELFELDTRFLQVGEGLFHQLDRAGALNHHVLPDEASIDSAVKEPPATGRAAVRGRFIREFAKRPDYRVGWTSIVNVVTEQTASLDDPFTSELKWSATPRGASRNSSDLGLRDIAFRLFVNGEYEEALTVLRRLLQVDHDAPSTHCHIARIALITGDLLAASAHASSAWELRTEADSYVVPRVIWLRIALGMLQVQTAPLPQLLGEFRAALQATTSYDWRVEPVLNSLAGRLTDDDHAFLTALAKAINDHAGIRALDAFPRWSDAAPAR